MGWIKYFFSICFFSIGSFLNAEKSYELIENIRYYPVSNEDEYTNERCVLDVYHPQGEEDCPTVVWFHSGGLVKGKKYIPYGLKNKGYIVVAVNYRLSPKAKTPDFIEDAAQAVAWTFKNIKSYGGARDRVFVCGASAGAYLSSMVVLDKQWLGAHDIDSNDVAGLGLISGQAITHFTVRKEMGVSRMRPLIDNMAPLYHVRGDAPPVLLVTGDRDLELLGRYEEVAYFARMLKVNGHKDVTLHEAPGADHGQASVAARPFLLGFLNRIDTNIVNNRKP